MCFCMYCLTGQYSKCELRGYRPENTVKHEQKESDLCWNIEGEWYDVIFSTVTGRWRVTHKHHGGTFSSREDAVDYLRGKYGHSFMYDF